MFGLIGHSTSFEAARKLARSLGFDVPANGESELRLVLVVDIEAQGFGRHRPRH